eukprot:g16289.t1
MRRSDENHPSRRPSFTLLTETQPRAEVDGRAAIDDSQHGVPIVADEPAVPSSLSAQPPQAAGDHNPIMRKQSSSEASAFSLLDRDHLKQLPLPPPLAGTTTITVSSGSKALDASTAPLLLDNELKLLERQVSDEIIVEERHYRKLDVVAGHGTNDEGLCMYTHNLRQPSAPPLTLLKFLPKFYGKDQRKKLIQRIDTAGGSSGLSVGTAAGSTAQQGGTTTASSGSLMKLQLLNDQHQSDTVFGAPGGAQTKSADHSDGGSSTSQGAFAPLTKIGDVGTAGVHFSNKRLPEEVAEKKSGDSSSASGVADQNIRLVVATLDVLSQEEPTSQSQAQGSDEADAKRDCAPRPPSTADGAAPAVTFSVAEAPVEKEVEKRVASVQMNTSDTPERDPPQIEIPPAGATPARGTVAATSTGPFSETAQVPREEPALVQERTLTGASVSSSSTVWDTQPIPASSVNLNEAFSAVQYAALLARTRTRSREDHEDEEQQHDDDLGEPNRTEVGASKQKSPAAAASSSERCNHDVNEEVGGRSESPRRGGDHNPSLSVGPLEDLLFDPSSPILSDIALTGTKNVIVNDHRDFDYKLTRATTTGREEPRLVPIEDSIGEMNSIAAVTEDLQLVQFGLNGGPLPAGAASKLGGSNSAKMFGRKNSHSSGSGGKSKSAKPVAPQRTITMDGEDSGFSEEGEARDEHDNTYFENLAKVYTRSMTSEPTQGPGEKIQPPGPSILLQETMTDAGDGDHGMIREVNRRRSQQVHDIDTRTGTGTTAEEVTEEDSRGSAGGPALVPGALDSYFDSFRGGIPWTEYNDFGYEADYYAKHFSDVESLVGSLVLSSPASDTGQEPLATSARNKSTGDGGEEGGTRFPSSLDSYYVGEGVLNFAPGMLGLGPADDGGGSVDLDHPGGEVESGRRSRNTELTNGPHGIGELNNDGADGIAVAEQTGGLLPPLHFLKSDHLPLVRNNDPGRLNTAGELPETHVIQSMSLFSDPASDGEGTEDSPQSVTSVTASYNIDPLYTPRDTTLLNRMTQLSSPRDRTFTFAGDPAVGTGLEDAAAASSSSPDRPGANGNSPARVHHSRSASGFGRGYGYNSSFIHRHKLESSNQHPSTASASDLKGGMLRMLDGRSKLSNAGSQAGCFSEESTNMSNPGGGPPPLPGGGFHLHNAATGSSSSRPLGVSRIRSLPHMRSSISHAAPGAGARGRSTHGTCGGSGSPASGVRGPAPEQRRGGLYVGGRRAGSYTGPSAAGAGARPTTTNLYGYYHGSYHAGYGYYGHHGPAGAPSGSRSNLFQDEHHRDQKRRRLANTYLVLEDVTWGMVLPCVCDIKIGQQTYDPLASQSKKQKCIEKYPLQSKLGFRVVGMKFTRIMRLHFKQNPAPAGSGRSWSPAGNFDGPGPPPTGASASTRKMEKIIRVSKKDSQWGLKLDERTVLHALEIFFKFVEDITFENANRARRLALGKEKEPGSAGSTTRTTTSTSQTKSQQPWSQESSSSLDRATVATAATSVAATAASTTAAAAGATSPSTTSARIKTANSSEEDDTADKTKPAPNANPKPNKKDGHASSKQVLDKFLEASPDFADAEKNKVLKLQMLSKVETLLGEIYLILKTAPCYKLFSSSLLFVYDMADPLATLWVYLIDFAHAFPIEHKQNAMNQKQMDHGLPEQLQITKANFEDFRRYDAEVDRKLAKLFDGANDKDEVQKFDGAEYEEARLKEMERHRMATTNRQTQRSLVTAAPSATEKAEEDEDHQADQLPGATGGPVLPETKKRRELRAKLLENREKKKGKFVCVRAEQEVDRDEGYLFGLRSLLRYVREMKARVESGRFGTYNPSENDLLHTLNLLSPD